MLEFRRKEHENMAKRKEKQASREKREAAKVRSRR
jgi:hypothetical protein